MRMALAFLPLASYFFVLGIWQSGRKPRLVSGSFDTFLLTWGLGGLVAFGPVGDLAVHWLFPSPNLPAWLAVASGLGLVALVFMARARTRIHIYSVTPETLIYSVERAINSVMESPTRTLQGFEDTPRRRGVRIEAGRWLKTGIVEATGEAPESMISQITPALRQELERFESKPSRTAAGMFALASLTAMIPLLARWDVLDAIHWVRSLTGL